MRRERRKKTGAGPKRFQQKEAFCISAGRSKEPTVKHLFKAFCIVAIILCSSEVSKGSTPYLTSLPPFVQIGTKSNVLIVLDNSNSMDEDFLGNAVGSYSSASKSVVAKTALREMIANNKDKLRAGLMTFKIGSPSSYYIHNSPYFVMYDPKSYCPDAPDACVDYCQTGSTTSKSECQTTCQASNSSFDATYMDGILTYYSVGSEERTRYCELVYPKEQRMVNPNDTSKYIYYKSAYPFYASSSQGSAYCYSSVYSAKEGATYDSYKCMSVKTGTSDGNSGYSGTTVYNGQLTPTDTDFALGYYDFGQRLTWAVVGKTWFLNTSPGGGYVQTAVGELVTDGSTTSTYTAIYNKLDPKSGDQTGYMSCTASDKNTCSYIVNAGLTPTLGTLTNAESYFKGTFTQSSKTLSSPITDTCQENCIVFVTDGLPTDATIDQVVSKISNLRALTYGGKTYDVKVYVLGMGLSTTAKENLDEMAVAGGTADSDGHAYYADDADQLRSALNEIFADIAINEGTAGAVATVTQELDMGDIIIRGAFQAFSASDSDPKPLLWQGHLESYWECPDCSSITNETDCTGNTTCTCEWVNSACKGVYAFESGNASGVTNATFCADYKDGTCWDAGALMTGSAATAASRNIFTFIEKYTDSTQTTVERVQLDFTSDNAATLADYLDNDIDFHSCSSYTTSATCPSPCTWNTTSSACEADATEDAKALIEWVRGDPNCGGTSSCEGTKTRNRKGWVLGDIVYSTPVLVEQPSLSKLTASNHYGSCATASGEACAAGCDSTCAKKCFACFRDSVEHRKKMVYVGGNDGMVHAFVVGKWDSTNSKWLYDNSDDSEIGTEAWAYIPSNLISSLKDIARCSYGTTCNGVTGDDHRYMVDLSPVPMNVFISLDGDADNRQWRTVLVGGEREGGDVYFALDVTDPDNPAVLWEYSVLRNMVQLTSASGGAYTASYPFVTSTIYDAAKAMPNTYSQASIGNVRMPSGVTFTTAADTYGPLRPITSATTPSTQTLNASDLSGWCVFMGGGIRVYNPGDWPSGLTTAQKQALMKPYFLMIDLEKGVNLFQYLWPTLQVGTTATTNWPNKTSGSNYIPYSITGVAALDTTGEGYVNRVYFGDLNGQLYSLKFNMVSGSAANGMEMDIWDTKAVTSNTPSNYYRSTIEPLTVIPTAAFDNDYNLHLYFGTGKYDTVVGANDDKTDVAPMSFYMQQDTSTLPSLTSATNTVTLGNSVSPGDPLSSTGILAGNFAVKTVFKGSMTPTQTLTTAGERVLDSALVAGGLVFFTTFVPESNSCSAGGDAYLYTYSMSFGKLSSDPLESSGMTEKGSTTGLSTGEYAAVTNDDGETIGYKAKIGSGVPTRPVIDSSGKYIIIQTSDAQIQRIQVNLPQSPLTLRGWKEQQSN